MSKGSLTFPSDPLAAMRELSELDDVPTRAPSENAVLMSRQQDILTDSNQDSNISIKQDDKLERQQASKQDSQMAEQAASKTARKKAVQPPVQEASSVEQPNSTKPEEKPVSQLEAKAASIDPLDQALLQKLGHSYPDLAKGKSTLVSSRLPDDIVDRLGLAADLVKKHKKTKQDVITRGLILAFQELIENDGAVEWYE